MNSRELKSHTKRANRRKRVIDVLAVTITAPLWLPVAALTALIVRITMGRSVLFRQTRIGLHNRPFTLYKFRTMSTSLTSPTGHHLSDSDRLTPTGSRIRQLSLDEIPQFLNVLRGDMALIGPRPLYPEYLPAYTRRELRRHSVRPGITGLAQVSGRNSLNWDDRLQTDVDYVEGLTARIDVAILFRTLAQSVRGANVTPVAGETGEPLHVQRNYPSSLHFNLRRFSLGDIPTRVAWMRHTDTRRHMQLPEDPNITDTLAWFRRTVNDPSRIDLVVVTKASKDPVAMLGLRTVEHHRFPELYLFVDPARTGQGIGSESLHLLFEWLDRSGAFAGVSLGVDCQNHGALQLYNSLGFHLEARRQDRIVMSLSAEQWRQNDRT